jgi:hypothetical protein
MRQYCSVFIQQKSNRWPLGVASRKKLYSKVKIDVFLQEAEKEEGF